MKIVFISRSTMFTGPGGDTNQIVNTAKYLKKLGVEVDVKLSSDKIRYGDYDLIHFFNVIRPSDILYHIKASGLPYVLSTIYLDYSEYDKKNRKGIIGLVNRCLGSDAAEYLKVIARWVKNGEKIVSLSYLLKGHRRSVQYIIRHAACLLPNSHNEYKRIVRDYSVENKYRFIPNAIDKSIYDRDTIPGSDERKYILCVARIDQYKNQLNLIRAVKDSPYQLLLTGQPAPNHMKYYEQCVKEAETMDNVKFLGRIPLEELISWYLKSKVHILPSWFETTGLSSLEAGALGCNLVITDKGGDTREYFRNDAFYCEPNDGASIRKAIDQAYKSPQNTALRERIIRDYVWENTAAETLKVYEEVMATIHKGKQ